MMEKREKTEIPCRKVEKKTVIIVKMLERCPKPEKVMSKKCSKKLQARKRLMVSQKNQKAGKRLKHKNTKNKCHCIVQVMKSYFFRIFNFGLRKGIQGSRGSRTVC